ncbi:hypothetical protein KA005_72770 [bacterium]|nr:hypothetical protein [bacterium]
MKCLCGYERIEGWDLQNKKEETPNYVNGDSEFKRSEFPIRVKMHDGDYHSSGIGDNYLYACPKCGAVKLNLSGL